jgi:hypothetical protein
MTRGASNFSTISRIKHDPPGEVEQKAALAGGEIISKPIWNKTKQNVYTWLNFETKRLIEKLIKKREIKPTTVDQMGGRERYCQCRTPARFEYFTTRSAFQISLAAQQRDN